MNFFKSEPAPREGEDLGQIPASPLPNKKRMIQMPVWAVVVAIVLVGGALLWPTLQRRLLQLSATPPVSKVVLPDYKDVSHLSLSYSKIEPNSAMLISDFEGADPWVGTGIDPTGLGTPFEGQSSLRLRSVNQLPASVTLTKHLDLSGTLLFEMYVSVSERSSVEALKLSFISQTSQKMGFQFPFTTTGNGWIPARMPRNQFEAFGGATDATWSDIGSVGITLVARPRTEAKASIDFLRGEGPAPLYISDWKTPAPQDIGVIPSAQGTGLLFRSAAGSFAAISRVGDAKDFVLTGQLTPLTPGRGGLFLRGNLAGPSGYSFVIGGVGASNWQFMRTDENRTTILAEGTIENLTFTDDAPYWLRATVRGNRIRLALSRDRKTFITVGTIRDVAFPFGEVGLSAFDSAAYVVHKIDYERM